MTNPDLEFIAVLQAQAAELLTNDEARDVLARIRPEWFSAGEQDAGEVSDLKRRQARDAGQIVGLRFRAQVAERQAARYADALQKIASYRSNGAPATLAQRVLDGGKP